MMTKLIIISTLFVGLLMVDGLAAEPQSRWAHLDSSGKLAYEPLPRGERIMDFSSAGYMGGGVKFPSPLVVKTVRPSGGDDTGAIQEAIDAVSKLGPTNGFRGAVLLAPGTFNCQATLRIATSGVVLRGSGSGNGGTTIQITGGPHLCISIAGVNWTKTIGNSVAIMDRYVPSGTASLHVSDAAKLAAGDAVLITHPVTRGWVEFMGMDKLVRDGKKETWVSGEITTERTIQSVAGNRLTLDVPLTDTLDAKYLNPPGAALVKCDTSGRISHVGIESLRIVAPPEIVTISQPHQRAIRMYGVSNGWIRDVAIRETIGCVAIGGATDRVTVEHVDIVHTVETLGAPKPADFSTDGTQILFDNCSSTGNGLFYFVTRARVSGPIVLRNCTFHGNGHVQPHQRWATGLSVDNCHVPEGGIDFMNRGEMGSGHGWTMGWGVVWNCTAKSFVIQQPPGSANWAIGCRGERETKPMSFDKGPLLPEGIYDSHGVPVAPASLYLTQLSERLGPDAAKNLGR